MTEIVHGAADILSKADIASSDNADKFSWTDECKNAKHHDAEQPYKVAHLVGGNKETFAGG